LMFTPNETKILRINDLIEVNMTEMCGSRFYLSDYYTNINVFCIYSVPLFGCTINFIPQEKRNRNKYIQEVVASVEYK